MSTPATLGARIAQARRELAVRKRRDIGQADIAKALHATPTSVSEWEADKKVPREATLNRLAAFLEVTPAFLRYGISTTAPIEDAHGETVRVVPSEKGQRLRGRG